MPGTITATRTQNILLRHVCSRCGAPIVHMATVHVQAVSGYGYFDVSDSRESARRVSHYAIGEAIARVGACRRFHDVLDEEIHTSNPEAGCGCRSRISGVSHVCPNCGSGEPWMPLSNSNKSMANLKDKNFPQVFYDVDKAINWCIKYAQDMILDNAEERRDALAVKEALEKTLAARDNVELIETTLKDLPEEAERNELKAEILRLKNQKSSLKFFDLKGRREADRKITELDRRAAELLKIVAQQREDLKHRLVEEQDILREYQPVAFGYTGEIKDLSNDTTVCMVPQLNDIPPGMKSDDSVQYIR